MSDEFEVHGPHDHAVEHAGSHTPDPNAARIAVMTAILATIGAISSYQSGANENLALFFKNEAAIHRPKRPINGLITRLKGKNRTSLNSEQRSANRLRLHGHASWRMWSDIARKKDRSGRAPRP